jgi:hypothetical protein
LVVQVSSYWAVTWDGTSLGEYVFDRLYVQRETTSQVVAVGTAHSDSTYTIKQVDTWFLAIGRDNTAASAGPGVWVGCWSWTTYWVKDDSMYYLFDDILQYSNGATEELYIYTSLYTVQSQAINR